MLAKSEFLVALAQRTPALFIKLYNDHVGAYRPDAAIIEAPVDGGVLELFEPAP